MLTIPRATMKLLTLLALTVLAGCVGDGPAAPEVPAAWLQTTVAKPCVPTLYSTAGVPDSVTVCISAR